MEKITFIDPLILKSFKARGVRKVIKGITGMWQPNFHSDVAL